MPELEDLARAALLEITPAASVGDYLETVDEGDGVVSLLFASAQPGYPDWRWTVSIAHVEGSDPTVLEAELMPAEGALLAPDWVPWSERLAEYKAAQEAAAESDADDESDGDAEDDSDDDSDDEDDDDLGNDILHGGDLDGVDIDSHDEDDDDEDDDDLDDDDEEEDDDLDDDDDDDEDDDFDEDDDEAERSY